MKALVCEMCGGSNLVKQEGVFICQNCKTKYSVEEARRMMIEGTVDVTGSTVKIDNSAKLEKLYKIARRAREDGNSVQAFKNYEQLQIEDPDNWEPAFFVAYYSAVNTLKNDNPGDSVRVSGNSVTLGGNYRSGLDPAINTIRNCLDSVFDLIEEIKEVEEQNAAANAVSDYVEYFCKSLEDIINSEQQRMHQQIAIFYEQTESRWSMPLYDKNKNIGNTYRAEVFAIIVLLERRKERLVEVVGKRRIDEYWDTHKEEKSALESEKKSLNEQIAKLNKDITAIPGYTEMVDSQQRLDQEKSNAISSVAKPKTGLLIFGIIAGIIGAFFTFGLSLILTIICGINLSKKNKSYKEQQANIESEYEKKFQSLKEKHSRVASDVEAIKKNIAPLENRIGAIDTELTKPR